MIAFRMYGRDLSPPVFGIDIICLNTNIYMCLYKSFLYVYLDAMNRVSTVAVVCVNACRDAIHRVRKP